MLGEYLQDLLTLRSQPSGSLGKSKVIFGAYYTGFSELTRDSWKSLNLMPSYHLQRLGSPRVEKTNELWSCKLLPAGVSIVYGVYDESVVLVCV